MKNKFYLLIIIIAVAILSFVTNFNNKKQVTKILPEITLVSIYNNQPISLKFPNKFILQLFATWCEKCNEYNHELKQMIKASNLTIPIFGIAIKDNDEYLHRQYDNKSPFVDIANDNRGFILAELGIRAIPETIFVKDNIIVKRILGGASQKDIIDFSND